MPKAKGAYDGWAGAVALAIQTGDKKGLAKDKSYKTMADSAFLPARIFSSWFRKKRQNKRRYQSLSAPLVDLGVRIVKEYRAVNADIQQKASDAFSKIVAWRDWDSIKANAGDKPVDPPAPDAGSTDKDSEEDRAEKGQMTKYIGLFILCVAVMVSVKQGAAQRSPGKSKSQSHPPEVKSQLPTSPIGSRW